LENKLVLGGRRERARRDLRARRALELRRLIAGLHEGMPEEVNGSAVTVDRSYIGIAVKEAMDGAA